MSAIPIRDRPLEALAALYVMSIGVELGRLSDCHDMS